MTRRPKKRGPGQPPLGDRARSMVVQLRVTAAEAAAVRRHAAAEGVSVSEYVRRRILG